MVLDSLAEMVAPAAAVVAAQEILAALVQVDRELTAEMAAAQAAATPVAVAAPQWQVETLLFLVVLAVMVQAHILLGVRQHQLVKM
jgi:hypothetical protein